MHILQLFWSIVKESVASIVFSSMAGERSRLFRKREVFLTTNLVFDLLRDQLHTVFGLLPAMIQGKKMSIATRVPFTDPLIPTAKVSLDRVNDFLNEVYITSLVLHTN